MGITPEDIQAQRELLERGERILKAQEQRAGRARLRDHFAAAALAGLLSRNHAVGDADHCYAAFRWADAMLRERDRTYEKNDEKRCDSDMGWATLTDRELDLILFASNMIERDVADVCDGKVGADARRYVRGLRKLWARFTTHHAKEKKA